jgi:hypothetical protein
MKFETNEFSFDQVQRNYVQSGEIRSDRTRPEPIPTGIRSAEATCKKCAHRWHATEGSRQGQFHATVDGAFLECPNCPNEGKVRI